MKGIKGAETYNNNDIVKAIDLLNSVKNQCDMIGLNVEDILKAVDVIKKAKKADKDMKLVIDGKEIQI